MNVKLLRRAALAVGWAALLVALAMLARSPLVWRDEMQFASLSYSWLHGGSGAPTIYAEDPRFPMSTFFYGPTFFAAGAAAFKLLGFSVASFRLVSWLGGLLLAWSAAALTRALGGSRNWSAACWLLVLLSPELGSTLSNGRMDTLAVAGELGGLVLLLRGLQSRRAGLSWGLSALAGVAWTCALLTTPRALQFFAGLALCAPLWLRAPRPQWQKFVVCFSLAGLITGAGQCVWLLTQGETPLSWLRYLGYISSFCRHYTIIGGFRVIRPTMFWLLTPLVSLGLAVLLLARGKAWRRVWDEGPALVWVVAAFVFQGLLTFLNTPRPESYPLYWGLPWLVTALALVSASRSLTTEVSAQVCLGALLLAACLFGGARLLKITEVAAAWPGRNPQLLEDFARQHIPPGSRVAGPLAYYFYAVERAGATYRFHEPLYDSYFPFLENKLNPAYPAATAQKYPANFLLWPEGEPLPRSCHCSEADRVARFAPPVTDSWLTRLHRFGGGYPAANLYRVPE